MLVTREWIRELEIGTGEINFVISREKLVDEWRFFIGKRGGFLLK